MSTYNICISVCLCHLFACGANMYYTLDKILIHPIQIWMITIKNPCVKWNIFVGFYTIVGPSTSSAAKASKVQHNGRKKLCKGKRVRIGYIFHGTLFGGIR